MQPITEIFILVDRSGSMQNVRDDMLGGINRFIEEQRTGHGEARLSIVRFDGEAPYEVIRDREDIRKANTLAPHEYMPRGMTPLYDATCTGIDVLGARLASLREGDRPGLVIFVIVTDGAENASKRFKLYDVKARIERQRDVYGWQFLFFGAGAEAFSEAGKLGIDAGLAASYANDSVGVAAVFYVQSSVVLRGREVYSKDGAAAAVDSVKGTNLQEAVKLYSQ